MSRVIRLEQKAYINKISELQVTDSGVRSHRRVEVMGSRSCTN